VESADENPVGPVYTTKRTCGGPRTKHATPCTDN